MKTPKLSVVLPTYNAQDDLKRFFRYFNRQSIARSDIELIVIDGGSTDGTLALAKANHARVIYNALKLTEPGVALGFTKSRAELVMVMASDNVFPDPDALASIVRIFQSSDIAAAFPKHDTGPGDNLYSRYFNTFTDPFTHFVYGDAANARTFRNIYKTITHTDLYDIYDYRSNPARPVIALAQGFTIRKKLLPTRRETSDDVLTVYRLIGKGKRIAYVHGVRLYHYTIADTWQFIRKQRRAVENALLRQDSGITKRSSVMTTGQRMRMYLFVPYSLTIIPALIHSVVEFSITGEAMWLMHWYFCFLSALCIVVTAVPLLLRNIRS